MARAPRRLSKADETPEFREFWTLWQPKARHTDGRGLARDTFFSHVADGADPRDIVDGARWFLRGIKDRQFIPLSATWLNRQAYEDLAEKEREFQARLDQSAAGRVAPAPRPEPKPVQQIDAEARRRHFESLRAQNPLLAGGDW